MAALDGIGAIIGGRLAASVGPRRPMLLGFTCTGIGATVPAAGGLGGSAALIIIGLAVIGLCCLAVPAMTSVALAASPGRHAGLAGGSFNTARQTGGAVGVALLGAVLNA